MIVDSSNQLTLYLMPIAFFFLVLTSVSSQAQVTNDNVIFYIYEDSTLDLTIDQAVHPVFQANFIGLKTNAISYDITQSAVWIKFSFSDSIENQRYLEITCPNLHKVDYYQPYPNQEFREYKVGFLEDFDKRPIQIDLMTFPTTPGKQWHYIRLQSEHFMNTKFEIRDIEEITRGAAIRELLFSLYDGLMLAIIAGVLFYIYLIRYYSYFYYIGYIIFISSINLTEKGFYFQFFWPHHPFINYYFPLLPFGVSFCMLLFLRSVWNQNETVRLLYRFNFWVITAIPFLYVGYFLLKNDYKIAILITQIHSFLVCFIVILTSVVSYIKSTKEHRRFFKLIITGLCTFSVGVIIYLLSQNHFLPLNFFTENSILIGSTIEVCFFTIALILHSDTIYRSQKSKFLEKNSF